MHQILKPNQIVFKIQFSYLEKVEVGHNYLLSLFFFLKKIFKNQNEILPFVSVA